MATRGGGAGRQPPRQQPKESTPKTGIVVEGFRQGGAVLGTFIETFGWPGTAMVFGGWFVVEYATQQQKQAIIDTYVLGKGLTPWWPFVVISVLFLGILFAQGRRYKRKEDEMKKREDAIAKEKSALQEKLAGGPLSHGDNPQQ